MSSGEAEKLTHYFAAHDDSEYPYEFNERRQDDFIQEREKDHPKYLEQALGIVTDNNFCIKCHLVGDFTPVGSPRVLAPRLDRVETRLRPDYMHRWVASPSRILPYTAMPVNIPANKPIDQKLFPGDSEQQLDAVVDLLMNFDRFAKSQTSIKSRIKPIAAPPPAAAAPRAAAPSTTSVAPNANPKLARAGQ